VGQVSRPLPGADQAVLGRVVVRLDDVETGLVQVRADVDRLTRATSALTDTVRKLPTGPARRPGTAAGGDDADPEPVGQRDWFSVTDPGEATAWLLDVADWWDRIGALLMPSAAPCWPWHPRAVAAALALQAHWDEAYTGEKALPVSDLLIRWVPALGRVIAPRDGYCSDYSHESNRQQWHVHHDLLPEYAHWWATDRTGTPPGLTPA
jgi:hypothetical protein